jgi:putative hydrolase of the HAD superfamily
MRSTGDGRVSRRIEQFDVVAFDADDTLWRSEDSFRHAEHRFAELVGPFAPDGVDVDAALRAVEGADISVTGYGVKAFTLSMVRAAITVTDGAIPSLVVGELVDLGRSMLLEEVHLLPHVNEVLSAVSPSVRTVLITKGDLVHQTRKVTMSGIDHHFTDIEIVLEKDPDTYAKILHRLGVEPDRFLMIGNSVRSDVLPVLALGAHAIHVPYHITWEHERVDDHNEDVVELASIADVPLWLGLAEL